MTEDAEEFEVNPYHFLDSITMKVATTLLENPGIAYNQSSLADAAGVSRDALIRRWESYKQVNLIERAPDVESETDHWRLHSDSQMGHLLGKILCDELGGAGE